MQRMAVDPNTWLRQPLSLLDQRRYCDPGTISVIRIARDISCNWPRKGEIDSITVAPVSKVGTYRR